MILATRSSHLSDFKRMRTVSMAGNSNPKSSCESSSSVNVTSAPSSRQRSMASFASTSHSSAASTRSSKASTSLTNNFKFEDSFMSSCASESGGIGFDTPRRVSCFPFKQGCARSNQDLATLTASESTSNPFRKIGIELPSRMSDAASSSDGRSVLSRDLSITAARSFHFFAALMWLSHCASSASSSGATSLSSESRNSLPARTAASTSASGYFFDETMSFNFSASSRTTIRFRNHSTSSTRTLNFSPSTRSMCKSVTLAPG
mmetsp:Transcript_5923/g.23384  ORF Transcript_5923/g.23384 Transcript_5923/m.23384 type:complete len:262 (+) Transcript_5923:3766-4551(+)